MIRFASDYVEHLTGQRLFSFEFIAEQRRRPSCGGLENLMEMCIKFTTQQPIETHTKFGSIKVIDCVEDNNEMYLVTALCLHGEETKQLLKLLYTAHYK